MYGAQNIKFERILVMKKFEFDDDLKIIKNSSMLAEHISTSGVERLYHNKELNRYFITNISLEASIVCELCRDETIKWITENISKFPFQEVFGITFCVGVDSIINGEEFFDDYEPKTQSWNDVMETYYRAYSELRKELDQDEIIEEIEWLMNDYQPITRIETKAGNIYEVYVYTDED